MKAAPHGVAFFLFCAYLYENTCKWMILYFMDKAILSIFALSINR